MKQHCRVTYVVTCLIANVDFRTYSLASKPLFTTTSNRTTTFYWLCYWLVLFFHYLGSFWGIWVWFCNSLVSFLLLVWFRVARLILWLASSILILWLPICYYWVPFLYLPHQSLILIGFIPSLLLTSRFLTFLANKQLLDKETLYSTRTGTGLK